VTQILSQWTDSGHPGGYRRLCGRSSASCKVAPA